MKTFKKYVHYLTLLMCFSLVNGCANVQIKRGNNIESLGTLSILPDKIQDEFHEIASSLGVATIRKRTDANSKQKFIEINKWDIDPVGNELLIAILEENVAKVSSLINEKNPKIYAKNKSKLNAIHFAVLKDNANILEILVRDKKLAVMADEKIDEMQGEADGDVTSLCLAVKQKNIELVKILINARVNIDFECGAYSFTPLMLAMHFNAVDIIPLLVNSHANIYAKGNDSRGKVSLFIIAWKQNSWEAVFSLINSVNEYSRLHKIPNLVNTIASEFTGKSGRKDTPDNEFLPSHGGGYYEFSYITNPVWDICNGGLLEDSPDRFQKRMYRNPAGKIIIKAATPKELINNSIADACLKKDLLVSKLSPYSLNRIDRVEFTKIIDQWWKVRNSQSLASGKNLIKKPFFDTKSVY